MSETAEAMTAAPDGLTARIGKRSVVFVGLMGAGKTAIGKMCAKALGLPFLDSDHEIEAASRLSVPELFELYGEPEFRALEQRVIQRLLGEGPQVLSTGGGAFTTGDTRRLVAKRCITICLSADLDTLMARVVKKQNRPLLKNADPRGVMKALMDVRYPVYGEADITVISRDEPRDVIASEVLAALAAWLDEDEKGRQA